MKKIVFILSILCTLNIHTQSFEGEIVFEIKHIFHDSSLNNNRLPNSLSCIISGEYSKIKQFTSLGDQSIIKDTMINQSTLLVKFGDDEIAIILEDNKDTNEVVQISYSDEYIKVLNYECQKAIVNSYNKLTEKNSTSIVYFTRKISGAYSNNFDNLKGFPLFYEINSDNITSVYKVIKIDSSIIDPKEFEINKEIKTFTFSEFKKLMNQ